jgi:hypothetical protein
VQPRPDTARIQPDTARVIPDSAFVIPDTARVIADSARIRLDSARAVTDSAATVSPDSLPPVRRMPAFGAVRVTSATSGVWVFERDSMANVGVVTVGELLERIPGILPVRSGFYAQPEAASALGTTAGRMELVLDGFVLDPLIDGSYDLSRLELVHVQRIVVERRLDVLRVEVHTLEPFDPRAYASVEAAVAEPRSSIFRGLFLAPRVFANPLGLAIERLDTDGTGRRENANTFAGWLKYAFVRGSSGLQLELRRNNVERTGDVRSELDDRVPAPGVGQRTDWVVRARTQRSSLFAAELFYGRSTVADSLGLLPPELTDPPTPLERRKEASTQYGARAALTAPRISSDIAFRMRDDARLPQMQLDVNATSRPLPIVELGASLTYADWRAAGAATSYDVHAVADVVSGVSVFGEAAGGKRGVPAFGIDATTPRLTQRTAYRAGAELRRGRIAVTAAALRVEADSVPSFGLPFDSMPAFYPGGELTGWELGGSVPLFWQPLSAEGWVQTWASGTRWIYVPGQTFRAGLVFHATPLPSGNLEILARLGARRRLAIIVPGGPGGELVEVPEVIAYDFHLSIRILEFRLFFRSEDMIHSQPVFDIPGRFIPGPRLFYGVRWQFWN